MRDVFIRKNEKVKVYKEGGKKDDKRLKGMKYLSKSR